jgi:hypothetical protein
MSAILLCYFLYQKAKFDTIQISVNVDEGTHVRRGEDSGTHFKVSSKQKAHIQL